MLAVSSGAFSMLLVSTGAAKLARPTYTARALSSMGVPGGSPAVLLLGGVEIGVGVLALSGLSVVPVVAQTLLFLAFLVWVGAALRMGVPLESCGCLGRDDTPPYWGHLAVNALAVLSSAAHAVTFAQSGPFTSALEYVTGVLVAAIGALLAWWLIGDASRTVGGLGRT